MPKKQSDDTKEKLRNRKESSPIPSQDYLSTGSTLLNLACSGKIHGGIPKGHYVFFVGDSASGKSFLSMTCLAEAANNPEFDSYRFIGDDAENRRLMDVEKFFGKKVASRLEPPRVDHNGQDAYSSTIEEFYFNLDDALDKGPCIYILDSMDALGSEPANKKFRENKKAYQKQAESEDGEDAQTKGSFGDGKAKINSANLRTMIPRLKKTGSILIIINQTRDNIGAFTFEKKTRSGGNALRFYATLELWSSVVGKVQQTVNGKKRQIGINAKVQVKKNDLTGKDWAIELPIYWSYGIDDVGSCVDYLLEEKHWSKSGQSILAPDLAFKGTPDKLISMIEEKGMEKDLKLLVGKVWEEIESACRLDRRKRYE